MAGPLVEVDPLVVYCVLRYLEALAYDIVVDQSGHQLQIAVGDQTCGVLPHHKLRPDALQELVPPQYGDGAFRGGDESHAPHSPIQRVC